MSWTSELLEIYKYNCSSGRKFSDGEPEMLPIAHSTANAQIEVTISEDGEFRGASAVEKSDAKTVIPDTGKARTGKKPTPYPLNDCLKYVAGDFKQFSSEKPDDNKKDKQDPAALHSLYMEQLKAWNNSEYSHKAVKAVLTYLLKSTVIYDCIKSGILQTDPKTGKLMASQNFASQKNIAADKAFVRFIVKYYDIMEESRTWKNKDLQKCFTDYNQSIVNKNSWQVCSVLGEELPMPFSYPMQIIKNEAKAKIFSANDDEGFTYLGRFQNQEQAMSISYEATQKLHCALRWLIDSQSMYFGSMTLIVWASMLQKLPKLCSDSANMFGDEEELELQDSGNDESSTGKMYCSLLKKRIFECGKKFNLNTKVMIMGLDAANQGRISISLYTELNSSDYLSNIEKWHLHTAWNRYNGKFISSFSVYEIVRYSFGTEIKADKQKRRLENKKSDKEYVVACPEEIVNNAVLELLPCIIYNKPVPHQILQNLYYKASNPNSYKEETNFYRVVEIACGMTRKSVIDNEKIDREDDYLMAYEPNNNDRSYLYGCLLAIADKAEGESYSKEERNNTTTNAKRYWAAFAQRPFKMWGIIRANLTPYLNKLGAGQIKYLKRIDEIMNKMSSDEYTDDRKLDNLYLLGYSHYMTKMFNEDMKKNEEDN